MVYKMNESIIMIQAEATSPNRTNVVFWSHDRGTAKLRMKLVRKNGIPQSLPEGTTVPIRLIFKSATAEDGYGKHDYLATIEDRVNGIVSIVLEDNILGYIGKVEGSVYIDFPNDRSLDTAGRFTFYIKRSPIDDSTPELEDYYFNGFSQTIDKIEQIVSNAKTEIDEKIAKSETQIDAKVKDTNDKITKANQDVATLNTNIDKANDRIDQTNQQIGDLGKLKKMYSNSIDFGDYDYSGNPNLMPVLKAKDFSPNSQITIEDSGNSLKVTFADGEGAKFLTSTKDIPALLPNTQYTLSADVTVLEGYKGDLNSLRLTYRKAPEGTSLISLTAGNAQVGKKTKIYATANSSAATDPTKFDRLYFSIDTYFAEPFAGTVLIENIKLEYGSTATPFQPNLLTEPYNMCREYPNENMVINNDPTTSNAYLVKSYQIKPLVKGKKYTITLKGTKPSTQTWRPFFVQDNGTWGVGDMTPVPGLPNVWVRTFTAGSNSHPTGPAVQIYQAPSTSAGQCKIDWCKLEEGDTRTPNISQFKYFGEGLKDSNNPNDYSWDVTPEYTEKGLNNTVSLTEPQSVEGLKNFEDGLQLKGVSVVQDNFTSKAVTTKNITDFTEDSIVRFERWGRLVIANIEITNKSANFAGWKNLMAFPLGYTPISLVGWGGTLSNKTNRNPALSVYANSSGISVMISSADLPANQRCSGTVAYFTNDEWPQG